jgi:hypothetical protein
MSIFHIFSQSHYDNPVETARLWWNIRRIPWTHHSKWRVSLAGMVFTSDVNVGGLLNPQEKTSSLLAYHVNHSEIFRCVNPNLLRFHQLNESIPWKSPFFWLGSPFSYKVVPHPVINWWKKPMNTIDISPTKTIVIGVMFTNLAIFLGHHIVHIPSGYLT